MPGSKCQIVVLAARQDILLTLLKIKNVEENK